MKGMPTSYGAVAQSLNTATNLDRNGFPAAGIGAKAEGRSNRLINVIILDLVVR